MYSISRFFLLCFLLCVAAVSRSQTVQLDALLGREYASRTPVGFNWIDDEHYSLHRDGHLLRISIKTKAIDTLVRKEVLTRADVTFESFSLSRDLRYVLFTGALPARRIKTGGSFSLYDRVEKKFFHYRTSLPESQLNIRLSPTGTHIGFVKDHNLVVIDLRTQQEIAITTDGNKDVLNGHFDWVYEEEFSIIEGWDWSPDGSHLFFWRLDQRDVPTVPITHYDSLHLRLNSMRYPKAGDPNSKIKLGITRLEGLKTTYLDFEKEACYIPRVEWIGKSNTLVYQKLNRKQNRVELFLLNVSTMQNRLLLTETSEEWIEVEQDNCRFLKDGTFIWFSERDGYGHFYHYDLNGTLLSQITRGGFDCDRLLFVDEKEKRIVFTAAATRGKSSPTERHVYSVQFNGKGIKQQTFEAGWHSFDYSPEGSYYVHAYSGIDSPPEFLLKGKDGKTLEALERNTLARNFFLNLGLPSTQFFELKTPRGVWLNGYLQLPKDFDSTRHYPVLMYVYGGPGSQTVVHRWGGSFAFWHRYLALQGYIIVSVDGRGTGFRGARFKKQTYQELGTKEVEDQISVAEYLSTLGFVDSTRIGIFGWSYGGYMASLCMGRGFGKFKIGIAGAPVVDWKFYDTIYTERFMDTPQNNPNGYLKSSVLSYVNHFEGRFLLIHGTADDNVHYQHSAVLSKSLQETGFQFSFMMYPEQFHGVRGKQRLHLLKMMSAFVLETL